MRWGPTHHRIAVGWAVAACATGAVLLVAAVPEADPEPETNAARAVDSPIEFGRDVRPILANNCFKCHGADKATRRAGLRLDTFEGATEEIDGGAAVVPGDPDSSLLIARVTSTDPDFRMPPPEVNAHGLSSGQVEMLTRWIREGAEWKEHWAFVPPRRGEPAQVSDETWCRGDLDRWVMSGLDEAGLKPSSEADRTTLIRRLSLDLTGLPPTPTELDAFLADTSADAYERVVDRLLSSPRFGEKWARWWLDLARYADTKGYEKDDRRTMWPYRDWVIRALNSGLPFDRFTLEQLAGDMLERPMQDQLIASAFHRNTMTNDEGGTDDEEFRVAAVIDRVNTTMEIWQGLTVGCAQCHTHKYDPVSHTDYYRLFGIFNNTEDADRSPGESPDLRIVDEADAAAADSVRAELTAAEAALSEGIAATARDAYETEPAVPVETAEPRDVVWCDDFLPTGAEPKVENLPSVRWPWRDAGTVEPSSGIRAFGGKAAGAAQQFFTGAHPSLPAREGDTLFAYAWIDPNDPPRQIMFQWHSAEQQWQHRAYWGDAKLVYGGKEGEQSLMRLGDMPAGGSWVRLEVDSAAVGLVGKTITGWAFTQFDGTVFWDQVGIRTLHAMDDRHEISLSHWVAMQKPRHGAGLPEHVKNIVLKDRPEWAEHEVLAVREHYLRHAHRPTRERLAAEIIGVESLQSRFDEIVAQGVAVPVMRELAGEARRTTRRFERGSFLSPAEEVAPGVPGFLAHNESFSIASRLELARWLFAESNPLTGRAITNRVWEQLWGTGLVETLEDLGTQGAWPSNQELLDSLALQFRDDSWSLKSLLRTIVTSAAYRQSSHVSADLLTADPYNRLLARGPRIRLDGEAIRDQALAISGLLSPKMYGPSVMPPQPEGVWQIIYSDDRWTTSEGEDRYRRGVYTFWRRTSPHPAMLIFDAPTREYCVSRRIRTNTPLQAFVTLNDPAYVECAQVLARRVLHKGGTDDGARLAMAFKLATCRVPAPEEHAVLIDLLMQERRALTDDPARAMKAATEPLGPLPEGLEATEAGAWTTVCAAILNLDEVLTKE